MNNRQARPPTEAPALIKRSGTAFIEAYSDFLNVQLGSKPKTREAYHHALTAFLTAMDDVGLATIQDVRPKPIAAWLASMGDNFAINTQKQRLSAVKAFFRYLVNEHLLQETPAATIASPKPTHENRAKPTDFLTAEETGQLLASIPTATVIDLRDRALIATMTFTTCRISAAVGATIGDLQLEPPRTIALLEKGSKDHMASISAALLPYLLDYLAAHPDRYNPAAPLFAVRAGKAMRLGATAMDRKDAFAMVRRRVAAAGLVDKVISNHSFRVTGITTMLEAGVPLEHAQRVANHADLSTTRLYDRRRDDPLKRAAVDKIKL